jgi:DNA uptake protein ComE-like DNA-binding protein
MGFRAKMAPPEMGMGTFMIGLGLGVAVGVLVAPERGERIRERLATTLRNLLPANHNGTNHRPATSPAVVPDEDFGAAEGAPEAAEGPPEEDSANAPKTEDIPVKASRDRNRVTQSTESAEGRVFDLVNHARKSDLMNIRGIGPALAERIIRHRPYETLDDFRNRRLLPQSVWASLLPHKSDSKTTD